MKVFVGGVEAVNDVLMKQQPFIFFVFSIRAQVYFNELNGLDRWVSQDSKT